MNVYQVVEHAYNDDDGYYQDVPEDAVYLSETSATQRRDMLNAASLERWNRHVENEVARRTAEWELSGRKKRQMIEGHWGMRRLDPYCLDGIELYKADNLFTGDPTDVDVIERFANHDNCLIYFTIKTLKVIDNV